MPSINTVKALLKCFSDQKAVVIRTRGRDTSVKRINDRVMTKVILLIFDNVQHFMKQRDLRIGRENSMIIGIVATYVELEVQAAALDVVDKRRRIAQNLRMELTIDKLLSLIDQDHIRRIGRLQWVEALTRNVPQLSVYKAEVSLRYRTSAAKLRVPVKKIRNISIGDQRKE
jgi:DNA polymerase III delta prime subunit